MDYDGELSVKQLIEELHRQLKDTDADFIEAAVRCIPPLDNYYFTVKLHKMLTEERKRELGYQ